jgi:hypothetical protein
MEYNIKVQYELTISESDGSYMNVIDVYLTDYMPDAMDVHDKWVSRGAEVSINKITTERIKL